MSYFDSLALNRQIAAIYVGYFGRAADPSGLSYWINDYNTYTTQQGKSQLDALVTIATSFANNQEAKNKYSYLNYPSLVDPDAFIKQVYNNLFNRDPDSAGLTYWKNFLTSGQNDPLVVGKFILAVIRGAQEGDTDKDQTVLKNKAEISYHYAIKVAENNINWVNTNSTLMTQAQNAIAGITATTDLDAKKTQVTNDVTNYGQQASGQTFTLTTGVDNIVGTSGNDTIQGLFGNVTNATFNAGDSIDGKGGNDTLTLIANGNTSSDPVIVKDIDLINVQVATTSGATLDALLFSSVGAIHSKDSVGNLTINNLKLGTAVGLNNSGTNNLTANFTGTSGTSDEVEVQLNKAGAKSGSTITRAVVDVSSGNTIEAVKVNVLGGDNYVTINGGTANKTLTIVGEGTGVADINTTNVVTKVDASAYKGKLDLTLGGTSNVQVIGTKQDDVFRLGATLNSADTIDGGDGNDVLRATLAASQNPTVTNVEKGIFTFTGTNGIYNASKTTGMTSVDLVLGTSINGQISNAKAELSTINVLNDASSAATWGNVTVGYASGANANATINIGGKSDQTIGALTVSGATKVTVQSAQKNATFGNSNTDATFSDATELTFIAKDGTLTHTGTGKVVADKVETLTFTADGKNLTINSDSNSFDKVKTVNVTATGAKATVHVEASPGSSGTNVSISEVNVKGTNATSELDVTVEGAMANAADTFTINTVNFEVNGTSGTQKLTIVTDSDSGTIAALNVKAAENATATVVLNESGSGAGYTIQGGIFEGKGNITIEGTANGFDLSNIDRSLLSSSSTLKIKPGNYASATAVTVTGTNGKDTIDVGGTNANVTVVFADTASANGVDTITDFTLGASGDKLKFNAFLGGSASAGTTYSANAASADLNLTDDSGENVGLLFNVSGGTLSASKIVTSSTSATGEVIMADNAKAVVLVTSATSADITTAADVKIYYVYDADSSAATNFVVELVGTLSNFTGDLSTADDFGYLFA